MKKTLTPKLIRSLLISFIVPVFVILLRPFGLNFSQSLLLGSLILVITWWVINLMPKWISSILLLVIFLIFSDTPVKTVFQFPLSDNFLVVLFAFLFSQGISNSGLTKRLLQPLFYRWIHTPVQFLLFSILCNIVLIFVIPQPFARIILLAFVIGEYLDDVCPDPDLREILMFAAYLFSMSANMMFLRGDIIMNNAVLSFAQIEMPEQAWALDMMVPSALLILAELGLLVLIYRKKLCRAAFQAPDQNIRSEKLSAYETAVLAVVVITMLLMATESLHHIASKWVILSGTVIMFAMRLLKLHDLKAVNYNLLIWLTAAFSIGGVMRASGIADIVFAKLSVLFPAEMGLSFMLVVIVVTMALHMILGSSVTTTSVVIPGILSIAPIGASTPMLVLLIYIVVYNHFLLPLHNAILVIGNGEKQFSAKIVGRFGVVLTILIPLFTLCVYRLWWQLTGLI